MHKLFLFVLFVTSIYALPTIDIHSNNTKITDFKMSYYVDVTESMPFKEILTQTFKESSNKITLGKKANVTWVKILIKNTTQTKRRIYIHNPFAYSAKKIEFYALLNNQLVQSELFDLNTQDGSSKMYGANAIFDIELTPLQTKTIYMKSNTFAYQYFALNIYDEKESKEALVNDRIDIAFLVGLLLSLAIYNMLIYFSSGYKENLYYSLFLSSASIWISLLYGLTASLFNIYGESAYQIHSVATTLAIFLVLFLMNLFETKEKYTTEHKFLISVALLYLGDMFLGFFNIFKAMEIFSLITIYLLIVFLWISISMHRKGNPLATLFLIGHSFFATFSALGIAFFTGNIELNYITSHATGIGYSLEAFMLAYIISYKIKLLTTESRDKDKMLFHQNKQVAMGEMIENIAHQWRQPLTQINSSVLVIDDILHQHNSMSNELDEKLIEIESLTEYLSQTIDDFRGFFDKSKVKKTFLLDEIVEKSTSLVSGALKKNNIQLEIQGDKNLLIDSFESELLQVLVVILNNAKDVLIQKTIKDSQININLKKVNQHFTITICDNAGGVPEKIIGKIFEPYFTTKHQSQGTGLGLYISKIIIEDSLQGNLKVYNTKDGACFEILLKE